MAPIQQAAYFGRSVPLVQRRQSADSMFAPALFYASLGSSVLLVGLYCLRVPDVVLYFFGFLTLTLAAVLGIKDTIGLAYLIPMYVHIGPIVRFQLGPLGWINLGDAFLGILGARFLPILLASSPHRLLKNFVGRTAGMVYLGLAAVVLSPAWPQVISGVVNVSEIVLVYLVVRVSIKSASQADRMLGWMIFAVAVNAVLHLYFYSQGQTLLLTDESFGNMNLSTDWYFKASHFYPAFQAPCTVAIILCLRRLVIHDRVRKITLVYWTAPLCVILTSVVIMGSRTAIISAALACLLLFGYRLVRHHFRGLGSYSLFVLLAAPALLGVLYLRGQTQSMEQQLAYRSMFYQDAAISMSERLTMWQDFAIKILQAPKELAIGFGPDVAMRAPDDPTVRHFMFVPGINFQVPSWHNFYLDVINQFGLPFFIIFLSVLGSTLVGLYRALRSTEDHLAYDCLFAIVGWLILWNTHATGWTKPVVVLAQLFAIAHAIAADGILANSVRRSAGMDQSAGNARPGLGRMAR